MISTTHKQHGSPALSGFPCSVRHYKTLMHNQKDSIMTTSSFSTYVLTAAILCLCVSTILLIPTGIIRIARTYKTRRNESYKPDLKFKALFG